METGRGMLEMLGVLVIFGVLTVGGIGGFGGKEKSSDGKAVSGYAGAIHQTQALEIMNEINMRLTDYQMQLAQFGQIQQPGNATTRSGYPLTVSYPSASFYQLTLSNVPQQVCAAFVGLPFGMPTQGFFVNGQSGHSAALCNREKNTIAVLLNKP